MILNFLLLICCIFPFPRYLLYIEKTVYENTQHARLGGIPGTLNLVKSFLKIKLHPATPGLEVLIHFIVSRHRGKICTFHKLCQLSTMLERGCQSCKGSAARRK